MRTTQDEHIVISIHALREEGDSLAYTPHSTLGISIHALREEGDSTGIYGVTGVLVFLSTPSARRATDQEAQYAAPSAISIHALREEGDFVPLMQFNRLRNISIHALREEGDVRNRIDIAFPGNFYPRPPRGGRPERSE